MKNKNAGTKKKMNGGVLKTELSAWLLLIPSVLLFYFFVWRPVVLGMGYSFFRLENYKPVEFVGLDNFRRVLSDTTFKILLINSFTYVLWSFVIGFIVPIIAAIMLNEIVHFNGFFKTALYLPSIVPALAASLIWYFLYMPGESGVLNIILGKFGVEPLQWLQNPNLTIMLIIVSMTWKGFGGNMVLYLAALQGVSPELYEAARLDGAGIFQRLKAIALPAITPLLVLNAVRQIIGVFQTQAEPMAMTGGGPNNASITINLQSYYYAFRDFKPEASLALGVFTFILLAVFTLFYFRVEKKMAD